jgi:diguanylate cyclase (GGDEF)-like protein
VELLLANMSDAAMDAESPLEIAVLAVGAGPEAARDIAGMLEASAPGRFSVACAHGLTEAVGALLKTHVGCVLVDVEAFRSDPIAAVDELATAAPAVPILAIARDADDELALAAVRAGAQDYLIQPELRPAALRRAIRYAIERKRSEVRLAHQAMHDPLTGLPNRALLMDRLRVALDRARRAQTGVGVLFLDVDNFKEINDSLGHEAGDRVLVGMAERLRTMLRPMDTVARFGGDEFTFLVEDLGDEREIVLIADRINRAANLPIPLEHGRVSISVSIGIAMVSGQEVEPETLIREADAAMYRTKRRGRGGYELFDERARRRALERLELENALRLALDRDELSVHYQPAVALDGHPGIMSLEALLRWRHPEHGLMAPAQFIPIAEETGLMIPIGHYVLEHTLQRLEIWRRQLPGVTVSVNLSARQLEDLSLISTLMAALRAGSIDPRALCLEIQETAIGDKGVLDGALLTLKATGVRLAIDDFGTATASLTTLRRLPIDTIKLHRSLVSGLGSNPRETPVVGAVVELGHALGISVVAEGVETEAQASELRSIGCDGAQGFLFGRPVPEEDVDQLLAGAAGDTASRSQ